MTQIWETKHKDCVVYPTYVNYNLAEKNFTGKYITTECHKIVLARSTSMETIGARCCTGGLSSFVMGQRKKK